MAKKNDIDKDTVSTDNVKGKKMNPIIMIILIIVVLGGGAFGGVYLFMQNNADQEKEITEVKVLVSQDLTVNLSDESGNRYVKTTVYISYDEDNDELAEEIKLKTVEIQDKTTFYLKSKKSTEFSADNEEKLKKELSSEINAILTKGEIVNVYFPNGIFVQ